jgi:hypothetical protein
MADLIQPSTASIKPVDNPRVAIISVLGLHPLPYWSYVAEVERGVAEMLDADVYTVSPRDHTNWILRRSSRLTRALTGKSNKTPVYSFSPALQDGYDLVIVIANAPLDVSPLRFSDRWKSMAPNRILYGWEIWPDTLKKESTSFQRLCGDFQTIGLGTEVTVDDCNKLVDGNVVFSVGAVDALRFTDRRPERVIDVFNVGRRIEPQHGRLSRFCEDTGRFMTTTTGDVSRVWSLLEHRKRFMDQATRSKAFITNYSRVDQTSLTSSIREVGYRYNEAVAAGCLMIGEFPYTSPLFQREFADLPGLIPMARDAEDVPAELVRLLEDDEARQKIHTAHQVRGLVRHDVAPRWRPLLELAGFNPAGLVAREKAIATRVDELQQQNVREGSS